MIEKRRHVPSTRDIAGALYVAAIVIVAAVAAWPIYRSVSYVILVAVAALVGGLIAGCARWFRWPGWLTATVITAAILLLGVPLAVPARLAGGPAEWGMGLLEVISGTVTGWKDLITVELPVGSYRNLLVPALVVFLVGVSLMHLLSWRRGPSSSLAVIVGLAMVFFGLAFGRTVVSEPIDVLGVVIPAPVETATGALALICSLLWLTWRTYDDRAVALRRAATMSGVRMSRRRSASDARRMTLGAVMIIGSVAVAAIVAPTIAQGVDREVLRSGVGPEIALSRAISPLAQYRGNFVDGRSDRILFSVDSSGAPPDRIRIATLDHYDGEVYRAIDPTASVADTRFDRVPSLVPAGEGSATGATVTIDGLEGIWMPTVGQLSRVSFDGPRASVLADSFYYNSSAWSAVNVVDSGLRAGDAYTLTAVLPPTPALAEIDAPGRRSSDVEAPETLRRWVGEHAAGTGGAALQSLVELLRSRGYLSHALSVTPGEEPEWMAQLPGYTFQPSASGHSLARIDAMFRALLERESEVAADGGTGSLVAAVGDDEQFAVAVSLIAGELGFPSRVVVGALLDTDDTSESTCEDGVCLASDISVWTEVQSSDGSWVPVDVTPQHVVGLDTDTTQQRDPENPTEVRPESAREVEPPDPVQQDSANTGGPDDAAGPDLSVLWAVLRIAGAVALGLGVILGPLLLIVLAKTLRRRSRRVQPDASARITGGWEEYVDIAVDSGLPAPRVETRSELAAVYATPSAVALAERADRAVFSPVAASAQDSDEFWRIVEDEHRALQHDRSVWRRLLAAVSLRSFTRSLSPSRPAAGRTGDPRSTERRKRRPHGDAHS